jgi:N-acetylglucosamine-6-phosphate deacetylase
MVEKKNDENANENDNENIFDKVKHFLMAIKNKDKIETIYFNNPFFNEEKKGNFYEKIYFENILDELEKKTDNPDYKFKSLKKLNLMMIK